MNSDNDAGNDAGDDCNDGASSLDCHHQQHRLRYPNYFQDSVATETILADVGQLYIYKPWRIYAQYTHVPTVQTLPECACAKTY